MSAAHNSDVVLTIWARTDVGRIRRGNEDCFMVADLSTGNVGLVPEVSTHRLGSNGSLMMVSDGMGGAAAGEIASDLSVKAVRDEMMRGGGSLDMGERLRRSVEAANRAVWEYAQTHPQFTGMGATMTAIHCHGNVLYVAQVGDSRAYLVRTGRIKQITKDQSLVQLLMDAGAIRPEQASQVPNNVILQALGTRPDVVVAVTSVELCRDDYILLCSDGLSNKVSAEEMRDAVVLNGNDLTAACRSLIELANERGGEDNITVLVARFDGTSLSSAAERRSITASMRALTSDDLLRIGGAQLDYFADPASDKPQPPPNVEDVLDELGVTLLSTQPQPIAGIPVTHVAIPALPSQQPYAAADADEVVVPSMNTPQATPAAAAAPAELPSGPLAAPPASEPSGGRNILFILAVALIVIALIGGVLLGVYWFVVHPRLQGSSEQAVPAEATGN